MFRGVAFYLLLIMLTLSLVNMLASPGSAKKRVTYTEFLKMIDENQVQSIVIIDGKNVTGKLQDG
ncbi:MAG: ATP-dependent metallopeptidase FtsH/Yme1/Tma family protein, partial [Bacillota bacterium]